MQAPMRRIPSQKEWTQQSWTLSSDVTQLQRTAFRLDNSELSREFNYFNHKTFYSATLNIENISFFSVS